jgi:hypothetical protein
MYYIYVLKNPTTHLPFYVGVGKKNRKSSTPREQSHIAEAKNWRDGKITRGANRHKLNTILQILDSGLEVEIEIYQYYEKEEDAFLDEITLIAQYGRKDIKTGMLTNLTGGGEGLLNPSPEISTKRSLAMKGRSSPLKGRKVGPYSEDRKLKAAAAHRKALLENPEISITISKAHSGKTISEEHKKKISDSLLGRPSPNKGKPSPLRGRPSPLKGRKRGKTGKPSHNAGVPSGNKGKTYEEMYGPEKAAELKEQKRIKKLEYWALKSQEV